MRIKSKRSLYTDEVFGCEDPLLRALRAKAEEEGVSYMQLSPHEGRILYFLARLLKAEKAVEIGSLYGYSAVCLARALPEHGTLWTADVSAERHRAFARILENHRSLQKKIRLVTGDARKILETIEPEGPFDMVFIDADKNSYGFYLDWAEKHLRKGGLLAADNTFLFGAVYDNAAYDHGGKGAASPGLQEGEGLRAALRRLTCYMTRRLKGAAPAALFGRMTNQQERKKGGHSIETAEIMRALNRRLAQSDRWSGALLPTEEGLTVSIKTA